MAQWLSFVFYMAGFISIITGIGDLVGHPIVALMSSLLLPLVPVGVYLFSSPEWIGWSVTLSPYLLILLSLYFIRRRYAAYLDLFVVGWLFLLIVNIAVPLGMMDTVFVDLFAVIGKAIIFRGMISPRFSFLVDDMKRFLISGVPEAFPKGVFEHCTLVNPKNVQRSRELEWLRDKVHENSVQGVRTILVTLYDLITPLELESIGVDERDLYLVRVLPEGDRSLQAFGDNAATLNDDLTQFDIMISEIVNYSKERKIRCDIILYTLSWAIHSHGWRKVYTLLTSKLPELKSSGVHLFCFYYPETHDRVEASKFEKLADRVLPIEALI